MVKSSRDHCAYETFFEMSHDLMVRVDPLGRILEVNRSWCEKLGGSERLYRQKEWLNWVSVADQDRLNGGLQSLVSERPGDGVELRLIAFDGQDLSVKMSVHEARAGEGFDLIFRDHSVQKRFEEELKRVELVDDLSGAFNRRYFLNRAFEELLRSLRYEYPIALLLIDIDHLKEINEAQGQFTGDQVIRRLAQICLKTLRNSDLFGRLGGGEFAALLVETSPEAALSIAQRIRQEVIGNEFVLSKCSWPVSVSIGISCRKEGDASIDEMLSRANAALLLAKETEISGISTSSQC